MPTTLQARTLRFAVNPAAFAAFTDLATGMPPKLWVADTTRIEVGVFVGDAPSDADVLDLVASQVQTMTLDVRATATATSALMSHTVSSFEVLSLASWQDGSKQHAVFNFTASETNLTPGKYVIGIKALTVGGAVITLGSATFEMVASGVGGTAEDPPENPGAAISLEAADARYVAIGGAGDAAPAVAAEAVIRAAADTTNATAITAEATARAAAVTAEATTRATADTTNATAITTEAAARAAADAAKQPIDADLTAIAGFTGTGLLRRIAGNNWTLDAPTADMIVLPADEGWLIIINIDGRTVLDALHDLDGDLSQRAPLASPALTGTPSAPTASPGDSSTKLATTAFAATLFANALAGWKSKASVRVASVGNNVFSTAYANGQSQDGVTLATGDRILIRAQSSGAQNGIYTVNASGAPTRATDFDAWSEIIGAYFTVEEGTLYHDSFWLCASDAGGVLGSTTINFTQQGVGGLLKALNLSDLTDAGAARTNLQLNNLTNDAQVKAADVDTDPALGANSDLKVASQKAAKAYADAARTWLIKTADFTAVAGTPYQIDTTGGAVTATLPASAAPGDAIPLEDAALGWATNNLTIARNGLKINGGTSDYTAGVIGGKISAVYISAGYGWSIK